jgi:hypothetical protein
VAAISYDLLARPRDAEAMAGAEPAQGTQGDIVGRRAGAEGRVPSQSGSGTERRPAKQGQRPR